VRLFGRRIFPTYPFEEAFFLPLARQFRQALSMPLILLGGINHLDTIEGALAEGFDLVAMARVLLREPDLVEAMRTERRETGLCIHCNRCLPTIYRGTRCVLVPEPAGIAVGLSRPGGRGG
jgi:2,4-dienoyl-CoA reductase-like NADH-dependent reductase (Old Yellow Enzyme family)